jgi:rubrerythrin
MFMAASIGTVGELLMHALAMEREAVERYTEFARFMADRERDELAELFTRLAGLERDHARFLERRAGRLDPPPAIAASVRWLEAGPPDPAVHEWLARMIGPREALVIALAAERRAQTFFAELADGVADQAVRRMALEFAAEEAEHAARLERALAGEADPRIDWERVYDPPSPARENGPE